MKEALDLDAGIFFERQIASGRGGSAGGSRISKKSDQIEPNWSEQESSTAIYNFHFTIHLIHFDLLLASDCHYIYSQIRMLTYPQSISLRVQFKLLIFALSSSWNFDFFLLFIKEGEKSVATAKANSALISPPSCAFLYFPSP